jgi:UDP-glucose 4-epimerase
VDTVVHLASSLLPSSDAKAFQGELTQVIAPTLRVVDACAKASIRFVLFSSGGTVYGDVDASVVGEAHPLRPKSHYGFSKVLLESYVQHVSRSQGLRYLVVRPSNPYGKHQRLRSPQGFIAVALGKLMRGEPLEIWGDGESVRDYIDVRDLADAVATLVCRDVPNATLNVGCGVGHSVNQVLDIIHAVTCQRPEIIRRPSRSTDVQRVVLDTSALSALIEWRPRALDVGIRDFVEHLGYHGV